MFALVLCTASVIRAQLRYSGADYQVVLDQKAVHPLQVWQGTNKIAEGLRRSYHPWALQIVNVDGDDVDEIAIGLTKPTKYLPFPHRTLFIMRFDGKQIVRKWAGSTLGRPLLEFCFGPKMKGKAQTLFTLESLLDGRVALSAHKWKGFGFVEFGHEKVWKTASRLHCAGDRLILISNRKPVSILVKDLQ